MKKFDTEISSKRIKLIDPKTKKIMHELSFEEAYHIALKQNKNLIEIHKENDFFSLCIIEDVKKFIYDNKKGGKITKNEVKSITLYSDIDFNDLIRQSELSKEYLEAGKSVKITVKTTKKVNSTAYVKEFLHSYLINVKHAKTTVTERERLLVLMFTPKR